MYTMMNMTDDNKRISHLARGLLKKACGRCYLQSLFHMKEITNI